MVKFSEMKYQRPDLDALKQEMGQLVEQQIGRASCRERV